MDVIGQYLPLALAIFIGWRVWKWFVGRRQASAVAVAEAVSDAAALAGARADGGHVTANVYVDTAGVAEAVRVAIEAAIGRSLRRGDDGPRERAVSHDNDIVNDDNGPGNDNEHARMLGRGDIYVPGVARSEPDALGVPDRMDAPAGVGWVARSGLGTRG